MPFEKSIKASPKSRGFFVLGYWGMIVAKDSLRRLTPWMELFVDFLEFAVFDLGIDLRCFDTCVS